MFHIFPEICIVISVYTIWCKVIEKFRWESGFLGEPLNGSTEYIMQLSVKEMIQHMSVFFHVQTCIQGFQFRSSTVNSMSLCARGCLRGSCPSEAWKFCILETESFNLTNIFRCKFNKMMKTKFQFDWLNRPQLCGMGELEHRWLHRPSPG